jgi:two-component system sensor histidine kinase PilS (NtrC family)
MLLEESWRAITLDADPADFFRTGLICIAFFGTAITAQLLARRVVANEELARERGEALDRQLQIGARIIRDMDDGVLVADGLGNVHQSNPAAERLLAVNIAGGNMANVSQALAARFAVWSANRRETVETLSSARGNPLRVRYLPAEDASGAALVYLEDIDRVQQQAQQLKLAALGRLTANIAHEIRNPLASISHAAELLGEDETDPLKIRLANIIADNARRLNRLVSDVLELGRRDRATPELLSWRSFQQSFLDEFSLHDASVAKRVLVSDDDIEFSFDRAHLHRVLWNLLANALRHASDQSAAIKLYLDTSILLNPAIHIVDDGLGIDDNLRAQIFEPFFTTHGGGTGLGLYIARELCEANRARLELLGNEPGAHFRIVLEGRP